MVICIRMNTLYSTRIVKRDLYPDSEIPFTTILKHSLT